MTCRVAGCKYPETHVTSAHVCGTCGEKGHGQGECGNYNAIEKLQRFSRDKINFLRRCDIVGCPNPETHSREAHHCSKCNRRHPESDCIIQTLDTHQRQYRISLNLQTFDVQRFVSDNINNSVVVPISIGMGCSIYVKYSNAGVESLFMHSDSWGQYGIGDVPIYNNFVQGSTMLDINMYTANYNPVPPPPVEIIQNEEVKCPLCRTMNGVDMVMDMKGSEETCKVCYTEPVQKFFGKCGHAVVCNTCYSQLRIM